MLATFSEQSIAIADKFIKTLCFIDDQPVFSEQEDPVNEDLDHRLNASVITKSFAPKGKSCSFYRYEKIEEEGDILSLAKSSDVSIIDWRILLNDERPVLGEMTAEGVDSVDPESDVPEKESRGKYALSLIEKIIASNYDSPKLIIVLTAEYDSDSVYNPIKEKLDVSQVQYKSDDEQLWFQNDKFRIAIYFKPAPKEKHLSTVVKNRMVELSNLPNIVNEEFSKLTQGFVLNTALQCISEVRANTFLLLSSYNKNLDPAYLAHKALLPNPSDAEEQLLEIIGSDIKGILKGSGISFAMRDVLMPSFLEKEFQDADYSFDIPDADQMPTINPPNRIDTPVVRSMILNGVENTFLKRNQPIAEQMLFSKNAHINLTNTFAVDADTAKRSNIQFAKLTTIKPKYQLREFVLTQGTIVKEEKNDSFWLCVQPKCDSNRIDTKKRSFLFLRLFKGSEGNFKIIVEHDAIHYLRISYKIYNSKSFELFTDSNGNISTAEDKGLFKFKRADNQNLVWVGELKNDYSQMVANQFSSELSRVGLDLSEWLRRSNQ